MQALTPEDQDILDMLRRVKRRQDDIPSSARKAIADPQNYANPLGMDVQANLFLAPGEEARNS